VQNVNTTSNKCTKELLGNVTKFLPAIDTANTLGHRRSKCKRSLGECFDRPR
jgi:hypothetical protein